MALPNSAGRYFERKLALAGGVTEDDFEATLAAGAVTSVQPWTGTATRTTAATYTAADISASPTEAEVQAIADALQAVSRAMKALVDDLTTRGVIT